MEGLACASVSLRLLITVSRASLQRCYQHVHELRSCWRRLLLFTVLSVMKIWSAVKFFWYIWRQEYGFWTFCSYDLDLDPITFIYELDLDILQKYLHRSRLSKVRAYRLQIDAQMGVWKHYHAAFADGRVVNHQFRSQKSSINLSCLTVWKTLHNQSQIS